jgi:hypothetical protein
MAPPPDLSLDALIPSCSLRDGWSPSPPDPLPRDLATVVVPNAATTYATILKLGRIFGIGRSGWGWRGAAVGVEEVPRPRRGPFAAAGQGSGSTVEVVSAIKP